MKLRPRFKAHELQAGQPEGKDGGATVVSDGVGPSTRIGLKQLTNLSKERPRLFPHQAIRFSDLIQPPRPFWARWRQAFVGKAFGQLGLPSGDANLVARCLVEAGRVKPLQGFGVCLFFFSPSLCNVGSLLICLAPSWFYAKPWSSWVDIRGEQVPSMHLHGKLWC